MTYAEAVLVETQEAADVALEALVDEHMEMSGDEHPIALEQVRENIAYYAGYYDQETRERVQRFYNAVHPMLGDATMPPTQEQSFALGILNGRRKDEPTLLAPELEKIVNRIFPPTGYRLRKLAGRGEPLAWLDARPHHCDRGRWRAGYDVGFWRSDVDSGERYYFDLDVAKSETEAYLRAKKIAGVDGAAWIVESRRGVGLIP